MYVCDVSVIKTSVVIIINPCVCVCACLLPLNHFQCVNDFKSENLKIQGFDVSVLVLYVYTNYTISKLLSLIFY